jgi:L-asparaginase II
VSEPLVAAVERSGFTESEHVIDVAVVDRRGARIAFAGDPDRRAAFRSSAKPIQARVARECGWEPADAAALAIACASHSGEPEHIDAVRAVLAGAGLDEAALECPAGVPLGADAAVAVTERRALFHNCSGKHAGMLAACVAAGWPVRGYLDPGHPLQVAIAARMREAIGEGEVLVDGCGAPTFVAPLASLAAAFLAIDDGGPETAAMRAHPFLVGGTGRLDTDLMRAIPDACAKGGAEGLCCISVAGMGIGLKARDGSARGLGPAAFLVLEELGIGGDELPAHRAPPVSGGGRPVGAVHARGALQRV